MIMDMKHIDTCLFKGIPYSETQMGVIDRVRINISQWVLKSELEVQFCLFKRMVKGVSLAKCFSLFKQPPKDYCVWVLSSIQEDVSVLLHFKSKLIIQKFERDSFISNFCNKVVCFNLSADKGAILVGCQKADWPDDTFKHFIFEHLEAENSFWTCDH